MNCTGSESGNITEIKQIETPSKLSRSFGSLRQKSGIRKDTNTNLTNLKDFNLSQGKSW